MVLLASALTAWFALIASDDRIGNAASARILHDRQMSHAAFARTLDDFRRAERLNPGTEWSMTRAAYLLERHDRRGALRVAEDILRREPDNIGAWEIVLTAGGTQHRRRSERAKAEIRRLNPLADSPR